MLNKNELLKEITLAIDEFKCNVQTENKFMKDKEPTSEYIEFISTETLKCFLNLRTVIAKTLEDL